jgi:hypothetical protein
MMHRPRSTTVLRACRILMTGVAALWLGGCVTNSDFGRIRPELTSDTMHDWVGRDAVAGIGGPPSEFRLTDDELQLRDRAYALIEPPYNRQRFDSVWREYGFGRDRRNELHFDRSGYLRRLHETYRRSEASAYARIVTDARNDVEQIGPFFLHAARVTDMDRRRAASLAHITAPTPRERRNAIVRTKENQAVIAWVCGALRDRAAAYRFALERLVVAVPSPGAAEADRAVGMLKIRIGQYCGGGSVVAAKG